MGMDASWQLRWQSAGPAFVEHVVAADGLHWITAGEVAPTGELRVWQQDGRCKPRGLRARPCGLTRTLRAAH